MPCKSFIKEYPNDTDCVEYDGSAIEITADENGKWFIITNKTKKRIMKIKIDNCIIKNEQKKCDYLFIDCDKSTLYFVELKGRNVSYAVKQILATLEKIKTCKFYKNSDSVNAYIVSSKRNPNIISSERNDVDTELTAKNGKLEFSKIKYILHV
ncbi:MAG: hypothetical protein H7843_02655 [Nitrospirota bacterium]